MLPNNDAMVEEDEDGPIGSARYCEWYTSRTEEWGPRCFHVSPTNLLPLDDDASLAPAAGSHAPLHLRRPLATASA